MLISTNALASPFILIPAYQLDTALMVLVEQLQTLNDTYPIIIVNDGSTLETSKAILAQLINFPNIYVVQHAINLGKGEALKTGFNHYLTLTDSTSPGVITADADGQHSPKDIIKLCQSLRLTPNAMHLGVREFNKTDIPLRSKFGNNLTKYVLNFTSHIKLQDTQTGLRAIPRSFVHDLLESKLSGYEFELEMLLRASKQKIPINEINIETIYENNNKSSHFNPILDSLKIYFVFIRFASVSILSAIIDFGVFGICFYFTKNILGSMLTGRIISGICNYTLNQRFSFKSTEKYTPLLEYCLLAIGLTSCSYFLINAFKDMHVSVYISKIIAESILFIASFSIQKLFIFKRNKKLLAK